MLGNCDMYVCNYVRVYVHVYVHAHPHCIVGAYTQYTYIYIYIYIYIYTYMYMYSCIHTHISDTNPAYVHLTEALRQVRE